MDIKQQHVMKHNTGDSAEWIRIILAHDGDQVLGILGLTALKLFPEKVFLSDHYSNFIWAIIGK